MNKLQAKQFVPANHIKHESHTVHNLLIGASVVVFAILVIFG